MCATRMIFWFYESWAIFVFLDELHLSYDGATGGKHSCHSALS